jgi:hypothetical protein
MVSACLDMTMQRLRIREYLSTGTMEIVGCRGTLNCGLLIALVVSGDKSLMLSTLVSVAPASGIEFLITVPAFPLSVNHNIRH